MNALDFIAAGTGAWLIVAATICTVPHRFRRRHREPERTHWTAELPPVPTPRPAEPSWLDSVTVDCLLDDDPILHQRFYALVDAEQWFTP